MANDSRYSEEHIRAALAHSRTSFSDFMDQILSDHSNDVRFFFYIDNLLIVIYDHFLDHKFITKTQACRMIPVGHTNTCKRYVEEAEKRGYIKFVKDKKDPRRLNVVPTEELIAYVRSKMETAIDEARELIGNVTEVGGALPNDNHPLAEYPDR